MPQSQPHIQQFLDYLKFQKRYARHTIISYETDLAAFFAFLQQTFGEMEIAAIKPAFVRSWLADLKKNGLESKSINRKISALKSFFKYLLKQQIIAVSPAATIVSLKTSKRLPQFVAQKDIDTLFDYVEFPGNWNGTTERLLLQVLYNTGIRQAELIGLKESHIDAYSNSIKVLGKGNKERIIPVAKSLMQQLQHYLAEKRKQFEKPDTEVLLVGATGKKLYPKYVYNVAKKYLTEITTIEKRSPHVLRHTFATHLMNNGAELNAVKELLGHSSLAATQVYTHNTIEKLKDIHKKAHPKA